MRRRILALLSAGLALLPLGASANPVFTHAIDFGFSTATKFGKNDAVYSGGLAALFSYDRPGINLQVGGTYDHAPGSSHDGWGANGDVFWRSDRGSVGISAGYGNLNAGPTRKTATSYGAFGEWYLLPAITLRAKGGAFDGDITGWYTSGGFAYYPTAYISLSASYNYTRVSGGHIHNLDINSEYLLSRRFPLSVVVGYEHTATSTTINDALMARLRYRIGVGGSLVRLDRNGPTTWDGLVPLR